MQHKHTQSDDIIRTFVCSRGTIAFCGTIPTRLNLTVTVTCIDQQVNEGEGNNWSLFQKRHLVGTKNLCAFEECLVWTPKSLCPSVCKSMQLNHLLDFHKIWLRSSVKRFPASGGRHVTYGYKRIYNCIFNIS